MHSSQERKIIKWTFLDDIKEREESTLEQKYKTHTFKSSRSKMTDHFIRHQKSYVASTMALAGMMYPIVGLAAGNTPEAMGGRNIIILLQKASFWVGMGITIWGIVEAMLDFPGWKGRITKGILGYIGILLVPLVFVELQNSLQVDVWQQIDGRGVE